MELSGYEKTRNKKSLNLVLTFLIMSVEQLLCMAFPFHFISGALGQYDMRSVPMIAGVLYGGNLIGLMLFLEFTVVQQILGGPMVLYSTAIYFVTIVIVMLLRKRFLSVSRKGKLGLGIIPIVMIFVPSFVVVAFLRGHTVQSTVEFTLYSLGNLFSLWLTILILEYTNDKYRMQEEIQLSEKYRLISELAASIAHEIRNPMTVARGFLQLMEEGESRPPNPAYIRTAIGELDRAHEIIEQYLTLARPHKDVAVSLEPSSQIKYAIEVLRPYAMMRNVSIDYASSGCRGSIFADPQKFIQMIVNIAKNGIEAMPRGGKLEITQHCEESFVVIQISDTGQGMTEEVLSRLGEPYYSTKTDGTGLGMMASYRICQTMRGHIVVKSELGKGSQFTIKIPFSQSTISLAERSQAVESKASS